MTPSPLIVCPVATMLDEHEDLDERAFGTLIERLIPLVDRLFVLGSSGEAATLRDDVRQRAVRSLVDRVAGRRPVWLGIAETSTGRALDAIEELAIDGVDSVVVTGPYYYSAPDQMTLARHFTTIAERSPVPTFLYNIPQYTGLSLAPETVLDLSEHPNISGIKDSAGDMITFHGFLAARSVAFRVFQGREHLAAISLWLGCDGVISALSNFGATLLRGLADAVISGDRSAAMGLQERVTSAARVFGLGHFVPCLKAAIASQGIGTGMVAAPLTPLGLAQRERVGAIMREAGLVET